MSHDAVVSDDPIRDVLARGRMENPSSLETAERRFREAQDQFEENPTEENDRRVRLARSWLDSEKDRERRHGGPIRPPVDESAPGE